LKDYIIYGDSLVNISELNGRKVITTDAFNVGKVLGAEMDNQWNITHIIVQLSKDATNELGFKKHVLGHITICLPVKLIQGFEDVVTLGIKREGLNGLPECKEK